MPNNVPATLDVKKIETLAKKFEDFGFGVADAHGLTTHGFSPEGLEKFVEALIQLRDKQWDDFLQERGIANLTWSS